MYYTYRMAGLDRADHLLFQLKAPEENFEVVKKVIFLDFRGLPCE
jgi:hypothetical protein